MLDLATTVTISCSWRPTLLPSFIVIRKLQLLLYYLHGLSEGLLSIYTCLYITGVLFYSCMTNEII